MFPPVLNKKFLAGGFFFENLSKLICSVVFAESRSSIRNELSSKSDFLVRGFQWMWTFSQNHTSKLQCLGLQILKLFKFPIQFLLEMRTLKGVKKAAVDAMTTWFIRELNGRKNRRSDCGVWKAISIKAKLIASASDFNRMTKNIFASARARWASRRSKQRFL